MSNMSLTDFTGTDDTKNTTESTGSTETSKVGTDQTEGTQKDNTETPEIPISDTEVQESHTKSGFCKVPTHYPTEEIKELADQTNTKSLQTSDGPVTPTFATIAGDGHMGVSDGIENKEAVLSVLQKLTDLPVILSGGGMNTPMGSGAVYGRVKDTTECENAVQPHIEEVYRLRKTAKDKIRKPKLRSYTIEVPTSKSDCRQAITALSEWEQGKIDYLDPTKKRKASQIREQIHGFSRLKPGDKIDVPCYSTTLDVISKPFVTHAVIPRMNFKDKTREVIAITVSNPRGGYYQIGLSTSVSITSKTALTCFMSSSDSSPPKPNTAFTRDNKFSVTEVNITTIPDPSYPDVVEPDKEVMESPLPEPRLQKSIDDLKGVGEKTVHKIFKITEKRSSAHTIAHSIFNEQNMHPNTLPQIRQVLDSLPNSKSIYDQLESLAVKTKVPQ